MTPRQHTILKLALSYLQANIDDALDAFAADTDEDPDNEAGMISYNGEIMQPPTEEEIEELHKILQV